MAYDTPLGKSPTSIEINLFKSWSERKEAKKTALISKKQPSELVFIGSKEILSLASELSMGNHYPRGGSPTFHTNRGFSIMKSTIQYLIASILVLSSQAVFAVNDGGTGAPTEEKTTSSFWDLVNWLITAWTF